MRHVSYSPGLVAVFIGPGKATHSNIHVSKEFGISITSHELAAPASTAGRDSISREESRQDQGTMLPFARIYEFRPQNLSEKGIIYVGKNLIAQKNTPEAKECLSFALFFASFLVAHDVGTQTVYGAAHSNNVIKLVLIDYPYLEKEYARISPEL
jgi:hypothetical protein